MGLCTLTVLPTPAGVSVIRHVSARVPLPTRSSVAVPELVRCTPRIRLDRQLVIELGVRCEVKAIAESDARAAKAGDEPASFDAVGDEPHAAKPRSGNAARMAKSFVM